MENKKIALLIIGMAGIFSLLVMPRIAYAETVYYTLDSGTAGETMAMGNAGGSDRSFVGEEIHEGTSFAGVDFNRVQLKLGRSGDPTGLMFVGVWSNSSTPTQSNYSCLIGTIDAVAIDNLGAGQHLVNVTKSSGTCTATIGGVVGAYYNPDGTTTNTLTFGRSGSDLRETTKAHIAYYTPSSATWTDVTGADLNGLIVLTDDTDNVEDIACIDTNLNGEADLCFTDTNLDGVADNGQAGALGAFTSNANVGQMGNQWFKAFNLVDTTANPDVATNGVGLFFLGVIILISYAFLVGIHIMAVKAVKKENVQVMDALKINPVLLLIMLFVDVGGMWYGGYVDDIIFYTTVAVMAGLGGLGVYREVTK